MTYVSRGVFTSGDAEIAYLDAGEGAPIVLVHGFASTKETNWLAPGWIDTLTRAGRRAIALDDRGHGASTKLYDPAALPQRHHGRGRARPDGPPRPAARRPDGLLDGRAHRGGPGARPSGPRAQPDPRRARHRAGRRGRPAGDDRRGAGGAVDHPGDRPAGLCVPRLRAADQVRPQGARRLHPRRAPDPVARGGGPHRGADPDRGRHQGFGRRLGARSWRR